MTGSCDDSREMFNSATSSELNSRITGQFATGTDGLLDTNARLSSFKNSPVAENIVFNSFRLADI